MVLPRRAISTAVALPWHVRRTSNDFPAAQGNMLALLGSVMLVLYMVLSRN